MKLDLPKLVCSSEDNCRNICLQQVLDYYGVKKDIQEIDSFCLDTEKFRDWDYLLGQYALLNNFQSVVHTRSLTVFDPTWFELNPSDLEKKVRRKQNILAKLSRDYPGFLKFSREAEEVAKFLEKGGEICFDPISNKLIETYLSMKIPVIATLTGQLIYNLPKELNGMPDEFQGDPWKHSLVIYGSNNNSYLVSDPSRIDEKERYPVKKDLLIDGIIRYDSNLLVVYPKGNP